MNFKHRQFQKLQSFFFVNPKPNINNKDIYNLKYLNIKIVIEAPKKNHGIAQISRYQQYINKLYISLGFHLCNQ